MANIFVMLVGFSSRLGASFSGTQSVDGPSNAVVGLGLMTDPSVAILLLKLRTEAGLSGSGFNRVGGIGAPRSKSEMKSWMISSSSEITSLTLKSDSNSTLDLESISSTLFRPGNMSHSVPLSVELDLEVGRSLRPQLGVESDSSSSSRSMLVSG